MNVADSGQDFDVIVVWTGGGQTQNSRKHENSQQCMISRLKIVSLTKGKTLNGHAHMKKASHEWGNRVVSRLYTVLLHKQATALKASLNDIIQYSQSCAMQKNHVEGG
jgi:hypothetical protein